MITSSINGFGFLAGQDQPAPERKTLLFIHGAGQNSLFWSHQVRGLAPRFNTFALDLPGHHRSDGPLRATVSDMAESVLGFMDAAGLTSVVPCGLSLGGAIVLELLLSHPDRFAEAVLVNTGARLRVLPEVLAAVRDDYDGYLKALVEFAIPNAKRTREVEATLGAATERENAPAVADLAACDAFDVMARLSGIRARVLVMAAEKDISTPLKYGHLLCDKIDNASFALIDGCGHFSPIESPKAFNKRIGAFLSGHPDCQETNLPRTAG